MSDMLPMDSEQVYKFAAQLDHLVWAYGSGSVRRFVLDKIVEAAQQVPGYMPQNPTGAQRIAAERQRQMDKESK